MTDPTIQRIEAFPFSRGAVQVERRNRGYSIYHAASGAPLARLRSDRASNHFEVLYWSLSKDGWAATGPFGRTVLPLDQALRFIATEDIFWALL
jgi:hypothetical protein